MYKKQFLSPTDSGVLRNCPVCLVKPATIWLFVEVIVN